MTRESRGIRAKNVLEMKETPPFSSNYRPYAYLTVPENFLTLSSTIKAPAPPSGSRAWQ